MRRCQRWMGWEQNHLQGHGWFAMTQPGRRWAFNHQFSINSWNQTLCGTVVRKARLTFMLKNVGTGNSLAVEWLELCTFTTEGSVQSLVGKLRSHELHDMTEKKMLGLERTLELSSQPFFCQAFLKPWNSCFKAVVPSLFGARDRFHERQFFHGPGLGGGMVWGWFNHLLCTLFLI